MELENLVKVSGYSFEDIQKILVENSTPHSVTMKPTQGHGYFRSSFIRISSEGFKDLVSHIGTGGSPTINNYVYHAEYRLEKDFDYTQLNGNITFCNGNLVEQTRISINPYL